MTPSGIEPVTSLLAAELLNHYTLATIIFMTTVHEGQLNNYSINETGECINCG
jgi:hypothetical protein